MNKKDLDLISFILCGAVGIGGATGQAKLLHNSLVHSYPFKMMDVPPWHYYAWIGESGWYVSIGLAIVATLISKVFRRRFVVLVPVVVCPLVYWLFFEITFLLSSYSGEMMRERNFEGYTGLTARYAFGFEVLGLIFWGAVIGLIIGYVFEKAFQILRDRMIETSTENIQ